MQRRNFLKLAGLGGAGLIAIPSLGAYTISVEDATAGILFNQYDYLKLDPNGVKQFVTDYYKSAHADTTWLRQLKTKICYLTKLDSEQSGTVESIMQLYLLSSDFFQNRMDESKEVKYIAIYNPHRTPCANPFSSMYYPPVAV